LNAAGTSVTRAPVARATAADVYGLGYLMKVMIFGLEPVPANVVELIVRRVSEDVVLPGTPQIPDALRSLLTDMLVRDPKRRLQSAAKVRDMLRSILDRPPAFAAGRVSQSAAWWGRWRRWRAAQPEAPHRSTPPTAREWRSGAGDLACSERLTTLAEGQCQTGSAARSRSGVLAYPARQPGGLSRAVGPRATDVLPTLATPYRHHQ
jgi:hypothetical protein